MFTGKFNQERAFGVEIEAYYVNSYELVEALRRKGIRCVDSDCNHVVVEMWKIVPDASIRGSYSFELVSPPLRGAAGLEEVKIVFTVLKELGARVNTSCGFHVHWDIHEATGDHVKGILAIYGKFESVFDKLVSPSRRNNHFCYSIRRFGNIEWIKNLGNGTAYDIANEISGGHPRSPSRYRKLNINSFLAYGTVEFRQHQGTLNWKKAQDWIVLTQCVVEKAFGAKVKIEETSKPTIGELFRCLRICAHHTSDPAIASARKGILKTYNKFVSNSSPRE